MTLYQKRNIAILQVLLSNNIDSALDCGCGNGRLLNFLAKSYEFKRLAGIDISIKQIKKAQKNNRNNNIEFFCNSVFDLNYIHCLWHFDAIIASEIIEHFAEDELENFLRIVFCLLSPRIVIITTPNKDYNCNYEILHNGLRHPSHRFEFNELEAKKFANYVEKTYINYTSRCSFCDSNHSSHLIIFNRSTLL